MAEIIDDLGGIGGHPHYRAWRMVMLDFASKHRVDYPWWMDTHSVVTLLLEAGADPDEIFAPFVLLFHGHPRR